MTDVWPGVFGTMVFFAVHGLLGAFVLDYFLIETKGKERDDVERQYRERKYTPFWACRKSIS